MMAMLELRTTEPMIARTPISNVGPMAKLRQVMVTLVVLSFTWAVARAAEAPEQIAERLAQMALTNSTALEIVTDLTTEIGPRLAGSTAEKRAAHWAKQRFERLGFDKVWIEEFRLEHGWERGVEKAAIVSPFPQPLVVAALGGSVATPPEGIEAEIVIFDTFDALLAAPVGSLTGKIAVITQPMMRTQDGGSYGFVGNARFTGPLEAARRGCLPAAFASHRLASDAPHGNHGIHEHGAAHPGGRVVGAGRGTTGADRRERKTHSHQADPDAE